MYATAAAHVSPENRTLAVLDPKHEAWVVVAGNEHDSGTLLELHPGHSTRPPRNEQHQAALRAERCPGGVQLSLEDEAGDVTHSNTGDLCDQAVRLAKETDSRLVCWSGRCPVWLIAAITHQLAIERPKAALGVYDPRRAGIVISRPSSDQSYELGQLILDLRGSQAPPTRVIGVVGDPNSGKSVFSWKLMIALLNLETSPRVFRLDADVRAPTAPWALQNDLGRKLRTAEKRDWNDDQDIPMLRDNLARLRESSMQIVLVDLPGGDFSQEPPQRIPEARKPLFADIPEYLLVQKDDRVADAWRTEVTNANPDAKIITEILSRRGDSPDRGEVTERVLPAPLERDTLDDPDPVITDLAGRLADDIASIN
jgi:hypothetical protein